MNWIVKLTCGSLIAATCALGLMSGVEGDAAPSNEELATVVGTAWRRCDGDSPCNVGCFTRPNGTSYISYNNGANTCGSFALQNCDDDKTVDCWRREFSLPNCTNPTSEYWKVARQACSYPTIDPPQ